MPDSELENLEPDSVSKRTKWFYPLYIRGEAFSSPKLVWARLKDCKRSEVYYLDYSLHDRTFYLDEIKV